ncbi:MAG: ABC transporter ATP-binding protein [Oscillospiraceae bacterium]
MSTPFLNIEHISKQYGDFAALNDINIEIEEGEFVCLLGPSGCGKTTLLRIVAGLESPSGGRIWLKGVDATQFHPSKRNFGIVFQSYALFPNLTVEKNVAFGLKGKGLKKEEIRAMVTDALEKVNMADQLQKYPGQLSGGQQQRIALARALVLSPDFLLLDEPLSALDAKVRQKVRNEIKNLQKQLGITTIMVTHDQEEALTMADKIVVMNNACVRQIGSPLEVYDQPNSPFVADFVGTINFLQRDLSTMGSRLATDMKSKRYMIQAIRPEYITVVPEAEEDGLLAAVAYEEFHGSSRRVLFEPMDPSGQVYRGPYIQVDVPSEAYSRLSFGPGERYCLRFQEDKVLYYTLDQDINVAKVVMGILPDVPAE